MRASQPEPPTAGVIEVSELHQWPVLNGRPLVSSSESETSGTDEELREALPPLIRPQAQIDRLLHQQLASDRMVINNLQLRIAYLENEMELRMMAQRPQLPPIEDEIPLWIQPLGLQLIRNPVQPDGDISAQA